MPYNVNGQTRYSLKEKIAYHTECANTGKNPATDNKLSYTQRVRHANCATKCVNKLNNFMKSNTYFADKGLSLEPKTRRSSKK